MIRLHRGYAALALALLLIEVVIALFVRDRFVRPYLGDTIAVILVYAGLRAALRIGVIPAAVTALLIALVIEAGQYFHILNRIGQADNVLLKTVIGHGFEVGDLVAYAAGAALILIAEAAMGRAGSRLR